LSTLNDTKKTNLDKKGYLQYSTNKYSKVKNLQPSLLPPPSLKFQRQQQQQQQQKYETKKDSEEQPIENKRSLDNIKENNGKHLDNATIQYPLSNTDKLIDHYRQRTESSREISLDYLKLQKDYINAFQLTWVEHMKNNVDNYLAFQDEMIVLYTQMCNGYLKNIYNITIERVVV
jgi:hypothetical protein